MTLRTPRATSCTACTSGDAVGRPSAATIVASSPSLGEDVDGAARRPGADAPVQGSGSHICRGRAPGGDFDPAARCVHSSCNTTNRPPASPVRTRPGRLTLELVVRPRRNWVRVLRFDVHENEPTPMAHNPSRCRARGVLRQRGRVGVLAEGVVADAGDEAHVGTEGDGRRSPGSHLPPGPDSNRSPMTVSPGAGNLSEYAIRSQLYDPTTTTSAIYAAPGDCSARSSPPVVPSFVVLDAAIRRASR